VGGLIGLLALCVAIFGVLLIMAWKKHSARWRTFQFYHYCNGSGATMGLPGFENISLSGAGSCLLTDLSLLALYLSDLYLSAFRYLGRLISDASINVLSYLILSNCVIFYSSFRERASS